MRTLFVGATALSIVPVVVGLWFHAWRESRVRALHGWLALSLGLNVAMAVLALNGTRTVPLQVISFPFFGWVGLLAIRRLGVSPAANLTLLAGMALYTVWWAWCIRQGELLGQFSAHAAPPLWWFFTIGGGLLLLPSDPRASREPLRDPGTLAGVGLLVSYAPVATLEALSPVLATSYPASLAPLWGLRAVLLSVGSLVFGTAIARGCQK